MVDEELQQVCSWLRLPVPPRGQLIWVEGREELDDLLGFESPEWFAAVTQVHKQRIIMVVSQAQGQEQLRQTLRHELVHWVMQGLGEPARSRLPAWFHEGVAEAFVDQHLLGTMTPPMSWSAFRGELPKLIEYRTGFGEEPLHASEGYALAHAFVERLTRIHGEEVIGKMMSGLKQGKALDQVLVETTGFGRVDHEQALIEELASWRRLLAEVYPQFFLLLTLVLLIAFPAAMRRRQRRWERTQARWEEEDAAEEERLAREEAESQARRHWLDEQARQEEHRGDLNP